MALFVQKFNTGSSGLTAASITVNTTSQTAGNTNIVVVTWGNVGGTLVSTTISSVSDGTNTYTPIGNTSQVSSGTQAIALQAFQLVGIPGGSKTITITFSASVNFAGANVSEYATGVQFRSSAAAALLTSQSPTPFASGQTFANANDLVLGIVADFNGVASLAPGAGFTNRDAFYTVYVEDQQVSSAGAIAASVTQAGGITTSTIQVLAFSTPTSVAQSASGEVLLNDAFSGLLGNPTVLQGGSNWNLNWTPGSGSQWVQANAGAPVKLTKFKYGLVTGCEDMLSGATLQASNDPQMNGATTVWTASARALCGALQNIVTLNLSTAYQYYRLTVPSGGIGGTNNCLTCLDIYATWATGCVFQPSDLVLSPKGLNFDKPTQITLSSSTTSASIYYTIDGSTPTTSSTHYNGPFVVSASCQLNAIASSPAANGNSRLLNIDPTATGNNPTGYPIHIGNTEVSLDNVYDDRGYELWAMNGSVYQDPVSKWWYRYGVNTDSPAIYTYGFPGNNVYRSADLRNWQYVGVIQQATTQNNGTTNNVWHILPRILYNASTTTYVLWCDSYTQTGPGTVSWQAKTVWTSASPAGPFTLVRSITTFPNSITDGEGDFSLFLDTDGVTAYLISTMGISSPNNNLFRAQLTSDYTNISATTSAVVWSGFGSATQEAPCMLYVGGTYFFIHSDTRGFEGSGCHYNGITSVMGTVSLPTTLPFQPVSGGTPDYTISYNSQVWQLIAIPGRTGGYIYYGDQYGPPSTVMSQFSSWRRVRLPITFSLPNMTINWLPAWSFDAAMPSTGANSPAAPTGLTVNSTTGAAHWTNVEPNPCNLYFDVATDAGFSNIVSSYALASGSTSFTAPLPSTIYYYRVRNVNASGFSVSSTVSVGTAASGIVPSLIGAYNFWGAGES